MNKTISVGLLAIIFLVSTSQATMTIGDYKKAKKLGGTNWELMQIYIHGVGNGYASANGFLAANNQPLIFCVPKKLALEMQNYIDILDKALSKPNPVFTNDFAIEVVLNVGLRDTFPCN